MKPVKWRNILLHTNINACVRCFTCRVTLYIYIYIYIYKVQEASDTCVILSLHRKSIKCTTPRRHTSENTKNKDKQTIGKCANTITNTQQQTISQLNIVDSKHTGRKTDWRIPIINELSVEWRLVCYRIVQQCASRRFTCRQGAHRAGL